MPRETVAFNFRAIANSDFDKGIFLINKTNELSVINNEINKLLLFARKTTNKHEQQEILCKQKILLEKKVSLLNEFIYSDEMKKDVSLQATRLFLIEENPKLTILAKNLDQLPMQKYGKTLHKMCLE